MAALQTPEQQAKLLDVLFDAAEREVEGPDSQGQPALAPDVWVRFKEKIAELGLRLALVDGKA